MKRNDRIKLTPFSIFIIVMLASCGTQRVSTIVGGDYDKNKDRTEYFVLPFGSTSLPGKWTKTKYNENSNQQFFKNEENVFIAIEFTPINRYEFNTDRSKKGYDFTKAYYDWKSKYFENQHELTREIIEADEQQNYIIWHVFGEISSINFDTYFLFGEKNGNANNFSITKTDKWNKEQKIKVLKEMYLQNQTGPRQSATQ